MESFFLIGDQTLVPCIGRWILNQWTTREIPFDALFSVLSPGIPAELLVCVYVCLCVCVSVLVAQSSLTLCDPMDCSSRGFSVHGILQARILELVAIPFFRGYSQPRARTQASHIIGRFFTIWATWEAH